MDQVIEVSSPVDAFSALPREAPLTMPVQSLDGVGRCRPLSVAKVPGIGLRRLFVFGLALLLTVIGTKEMVRVLDVHGLNPLTIFVLALFVVLAVWVALACASGVAGFLSQVSGGGLALGIDPRRPRPALSTRTALLMPTYNEAPAQVMARLQAVGEALAEAGVARHFDIFILSDTTDPAIWVLEEAMFLRLREAIGAEIAVFYRRRHRNTDRKAGNIAEWVTRFGAAYPHFVILDADSMMTADALVRLAAAMEAHRDVGIVQTLPIVVNGTTIFARLQQFAGRVYGPLIAHGIAWWHGAEANYWGHNAMIRTRAFAEQAGLPHLRGRQPFGGHILSHDFVEAALVRRGGWQVRMVPGLPGSYEEAPPSLIDLANRDRRWCQGNLQHAAVLRARGLHWVSRLHLAMGIGAYVTAPLWLMFLVAGLLISLQYRFVPPEYFSHGRSLFPHWPVVDPVRSKWLFVATIAVLLAPKLLGTTVLLIDRQARRSAGGIVRVIAGFALESVLAGLIAPVMMLVQSGNVFSILAGRDSGWKPQRRDGCDLPLSFFASHYAGCTVFGLGLGIAAFFVSPFLALWMLPVVLGLALAIPLARWTSLPAATSWLGALDLLRIPESHSPPEVLRRAKALSARYDALANSIGNPVRRLVEDPTLMAAHECMLPPPRRPRSDPIDAVLLVGLVKLDEVGSFTDAMAALTQPELTAVLTTTQGLHRLATLAASQ